ncbi:MAG: hypothetical protein MUE85_07730 [Microscillaceae bacterium]|jgi:hypothetical protein|nr:hypothetical protein [Microscillaceae bacterium]
MHPKIQEYLKLSEEKTQKVEEYCQYFRLKSDLENEIALIRLEFSDESNNEKELLLLEIELDSLYRELGLTEAKIVLITVEIDNIKFSIDNL